ncbi:MAG: hypothetical protein KC646_01980 [Candidatus Cloacimonetes bacterium]|nr:hypothetical protein [Candidatus Cloacimonadota bacterium]
MSSLYKNNRGFVIPIVIVILFMAAVFGAIYNQSIRAQRKLDLMFEHDLRSYYIAQAGFQTYSSRLQSLTNYEARWYTGPNYTSKVDYGYTEEGGKGFYSVFASEVKVNGQFQHVFLLTKGIYQDHMGNQNITMVKANLSYDPPPPSVNNAKAKLFITNKSSINKRRLLEFVNNPTFSKDFVNLPAKIDDLVQFLASKKVSEINFETQKDLLIAMAELSFINQKIRKRLRRKRLAIDLKANSKISKAIQGAESLGDHSTAHDFASLLHGLDLSTNDQLNTKVISQEDLKKADVLEMLQSMGGLANDTKMSINDPSNLPFDVAKTGHLNAMNFTHKLLDYVHSNNVDSLEKLVDILNKANVRVAFGEDDVQLSSVVKILNKDQTIPTNEDNENPKPDDSADGTNQGSAADPEVDPNVDSAEGSYPVTLPYQQDGNGVDGDENQDDTTAEELDRFLSNGDEPPVKFISDLIGEDVANDINWDNSEFENDSSKTYVKIFTQRALQHIRNLNNQRKLENYTSTGEGLTLQEMKDEFKNSMPDISYIRKVGAAVDKIHKSNRFSYYFNAHVMDPYKGGATRKWRKVDIPQNTWKEELYLKMSHISPDKLPRTNADFLEKFTKSTWGDSESSQLARGTDNRDEFMFLKDKSTGQDIRLVDFLQASI